MALIKCVECGADISDKAEICPHCGCPILDSVENKRKIVKRKIKRIVITIIAIMVVCGIVFCSITGIKLYNKKVGYYNNLKWGITSAQLEKKLKKEVNADKKYIAGTSEKDYEGIKGLLAIPFYYWDDSDKYNYVSILISNDGNEYSSNVALEKLIKIYDKRYGENTKPNSYTYEWETSKSKIKMIYMTNDFISVEISDRNNPKKDSKSK